MDNGQTAGMGGILDWKSVGAAVKEWQRTPFNWRRDCVFCGAFIVGGLMHFSGLW